MRSLITKIIIASALGFFAYITVDQLQYNTQKSLDNTINPYSNNFKPHLMLSALQKTKPPFFSDALKSEAHKSVLNPLYEGTHAPDGLEISNDGHLVANKALRNLFDYYLLGGADNQRQYARVLIQEAATKQFKSLPESTLNIVLAEIDTIYSRYIELINYTKIQSQVNAASELADYLKWLHQTRIQFLTAPVAAAFYAANEQEDQASLAAMQADNSAVAADKNQDAMEKVNADFQAKQLDVDARYTQRLNLYGPIVAMQWRAFDQAEHARKLHFIAFRTAWMQAGKPELNANLQTQSLLAVVPEADRDYVLALIKTNSLDATIEAMP